MSNQSEKTIENKIKKYLDDNNYYFFKNHGNVWTEPGRPDIVACIEGKFVGIEVKKPGGIVSPAQEKQGLKIQKSGGLFLIAYSLDDVINFLDNNL